MSSIRFVLLLVIAGALIIFVLQNWTPALPLVILGVPTQAIPLSFWMIGAIAAGAVTTVVISALFQITAFTAAPRPSRRRGRSNTPPSVPPANDRGIDPMDVPYGVTDSPRTRIQSDDDWEPHSREVWDDWEAPASSDRNREEPRYRSVEARPPVDFRMRDREEDYRFTDEFRAEERQDSLRDEEPVFYQEPDASPSFEGSEPPVYDADYKVYRAPYRPLDEPYEPSYTEPAYQEPEYREPEYREPEYSEPPYTESDYRNEYPPYTEPEREVWDDWEEEPETSIEPPETPLRGGEAIAPPEPQRPIVEVQQTPKSQYRSGTVYSYSYRGDESKDELKVNRPSENAADEQKERVIIPPVPAAEDEDEDWNFEDDAPQTRRSNDDDW